MNFNNKKKTICELISPEWKEECNNDSYKQFLHYFVLFKELEEKSELENNQYPILFSDMCNWLGYDRLDNARRLLVNSRCNKKHRFVKDEDYSIKNSNFISLPCEGNKDKRGRKKIDYYISVRCFKMFCMISKTDRSDRVREYFISIEKAFNTLLKGKRRVSDYKEEAECKTDELEKSRDSHTSFRDSTQLNDKEVSLWFGNTSTNIKRRDIDCVRKLIQNGNKIVISRYHKKHVMYMYVTSVKNAIDDKFVIKVGYTSDIKSRMKSLSDEYKSNFKLIGLTFVNREDDEKQFHRLLKLKYPDQHYYFKVSGRGKDEFYFFGRNLIDEFNYYNVDVGVSDVDARVSEAVSRMNDKQLSTYELYIHSRYGLSFDS